MNNTDEVKAALNAAAIYLSKVPNASKQLLFVADAIGKFIIHEAPSLDHAFGFKKGRGQYEREDNEENAELVFRALKMRLTGNQSWSAIGGLLGCSEDKFNSIKKRYFSQALERLLKEKEEKQPGWWDFPTE